LTAKFCPPNPGHPRATHRRSLLKHFAPPSFLFYRYSPRPINLAPEVPCPKTVLPKGPSVRMFRSPTSVHRLPGPRRKPFACSSFHVLHFSLSWIRTNPPRESPISLSSVNSALFSFSVLNAIYRTNPARTNSPRFEGFWPTNDATSMHPTLQRLFFIQNRFPLTKASGHVSELKTGCPF